DDDREDDAAPGGPPATRSIGGGAHARERLGEGRCQKAAAARVGGGVLLAGREALSCGGGPGQGVVVAVGAGGVVVDDPAQPGAARYRSQDPGGERVHDVVHGEGFDPLPLPGPVGGAGALGQVLGLATVGRLE